MPLVLLLRQLFQPAFQRQQLLLLPLSEQLLLQHVRRGCRLQLRGQTVLQPGERSYHTCTQVAQEITANFSGERSRSFQPVGYEAKALFYTYTTCDLGIGDTACVRLLVISTNHYAFKKSGYALCYLL